VDVGTDADVVTRTSNGTVAETVARIEAVVAAKGLKLFAVIDHSGEAHAAGLELRETRVVIFGSPLAGTPVMAAAPLATGCATSWRRGSPASRRSSTRRSRERRDTGELPRAAERGGEDPPRAGGEDRPRARRQRGRRRR
jgi:hypothetical protein